MADFDKIGGVSFHKGCYPGRKSLPVPSTSARSSATCTAFAPDAAITAGASIYAQDSPEHPCGMVANAAPSPDGGYDALAVIQENFVEQPGLTLGEAGGTGFSIIARANPAAGGASP